ncbi:MAG: FtsQ-type POTRA domain-containing protein [Thermoflexales bacterium]|nr:FtsQ-type POTRA domain-containing protein [Thermoflexales bacterium]
MRSKPRKLPARRSRQPARRAAYTPLGRGTPFLKGASAAGAIHLSPAMVLDALSPARMLSFALMAICLATLVYFSYDARFYVGEPAVLGSEYTPAKDVIGASELEGIHVAWVQPQHIAQLITHRLPGVRAAAVTCELPAQCTITVEERQPLFAWRQGQAWAWVDAEGVLFTGPRTSSSALVVDMPSGRLPLPGTRVDPELVSDVQTIIQHLPGIQLVRKTVEHGFEFSDPVGGWPVYLGSGPGMSERLAVWQALSDHLVQSHIRASYVNVQDAQAPYYSTH